MIAKLGPVKAAMLLVTILALLVALGWLLLAKIAPAASKPTTSIIPNLPISPTPLRVTPLPLPNQAPLGFGVVTSRNLNLRTSPNTEAAVTGTLKLGDIIALARRDGAWYQTGTGAWVSALYLEVRESKAEAESYARELLG